MGYGKKFDGFELRCWWSRGRKEEEGNSKGQSSFEPELELAFLPSTASISDHEISLSNTTHSKEPSSIHTSLAENPILELRRQARFDSSTRPRLPLPRSSCLLFNLKPPTLRPSYRQQPWPIDLDPRHLPTPPSRNPLPRIPWNQTSHLPFHPRLSSTFSPSTTSLAQFFHTTSLGSSNHMTLKIIISP